MEIEVTPGVAYYLKMQQAIREKRSLKSKSTDAKKRRRRKQYQQLKEATDRLRKSQAKQMGEYLPGIQCTPAIIQDNPIRVCSACKEVGHLRPWSKKCKYYVPRQRRVETEVVESTCSSKSRVLVKDLEEDGTEQSLLDCISFDITGDLTAGHLNSVMDDTDHSDNS